MLLDRIHSEEVTAKVVNNGRVHETVLIEAMVIGCVGGSSGKAEFVAGLVNQQIVLDHPTSVARIDIHDGRIWQGVNVRFSGSRLQMRRCAYARLVSAGSSRFVAESGVVIENVQVCSRGGVVTVRRAIDKFARQRAQRNAARSCSRNDITADDFNAVGFVTIGC